MKRLLACLFAVLCLAETCPLAEPIPGMRPSPVGYTGVIQVGDPSMQSHSLDLGVPIWRGIRDMWIASSRFGYRHVLAPIALSGIGPISPTYWNAEFGVGWHRKFEENRMLGTRVSLGSASDVPFTGRGSATVLATAFYSFPDGDNTRWSLSLFFTNNNPVLPPIPIPGFSYSYFPNPKFTLSVGIPFVYLRWVFAEPWSIEFSSLGPSNVKAEIGYHGILPIHLGLMFWWNQQLYLRRHRGVDRNRLFFDEKRIAGIVRMPIGLGFELEAQAGRMADRSIFEGRSYFATPAGSAELPAAWYASVTVRLALASPTSP